MRQKPCITRYALYVMCYALCLSARNSIHSLLGQSFINHLIHDEISDARAGLPSPQEDEHLILEGGALRFHSAHETSEGDRGCSLDVVVESAYLVTVFLQKAEGVDVPKVLKLQKLVHSLY